MNRQTLKTWFSRGKKPTETQFAELIDSFWHKQDDGLTIGDIINLATELSQKASKTELATAQADADVVYKAVIRQATVVNLSDAVNEYTAPAVGGYLVVDETENAGGIFTVDKTGNSGNQEKILVQLPAENSKPTAIKLIGASGNIVHWKDYAPGTLIKVWWFEGDSFEINGEGSLPTISDQRLKGDILDYDVANESAVISFLDSLLLRIDGENAMEFGQWGFRIHDFIEAVRGSRSIQLKDGENEVLFSQDGDEPITVLKMQGKSVFTADQRATALQQHRKVYCFGAEHVPFEEIQEIYNQQGMPSNIRRTYGSSETIYNGYLLAVTENGGQPIKLQPYSLSYPYTGYEYYRVGTVKDHYFYEDNTVVAGGVDDEDLAQFTTLNLGEGWLLQAGIGTFGGDGQINQPALPYGYSSQQWYMRLFDPLRRVLISKNSQEDSGATKFWHNGAERMRFTGDGVQFFGNVVGVGRHDMWYKTSGSIVLYSDDNYQFFKEIQHKGISNGYTSQSYRLGYISGAFFQVNAQAKMYRVDVQVTLSSPIAHNLLIGMNVYGTNFGASYYYIKAGETFISFSTYIELNKFTTYLTVDDDTLDEDEEVSIPIQNIMLMLTEL